MGALIDGEGSVGIYPHTATIRGQVYSCPHHVLRVSNTDLELISALLRATSFGRVYFLGPSALGTQERWEWRLAKKKQLKSLCNEIAPYCQKAQKYLEMIRG